MLTEKAVTTEMTDELRSPDYIDGGPGEEFDATDDASRWRDDTHLGNEQTWRGDVRYDGDLIAENTLTLGELEATGFGKWKWEWECYSASDEVIERVRPRINARILREFSTREIGLTPIGRWLPLFVGGIIDVMNELGPLYSVIYGQIKDAEGNIRERGIDVLDQGLAESISKVGNSEFPQMRFQAAPTKQGDYLSNSTETSNQAISAIPEIEAIARYNANYTELDRRVIRSLDRFFSHTTTL